MSTKIFRLFLVLVFVVGLACKTGDVYAEDPVASIWATVSSTEGSGDSVTINSPFELIGVLYEQIPLVGENLIISFEGSGQDWVPGQREGNIGQWEFVAGSGWQWTGLIQQGVLPEFWIHSPNPPAPGTCTEYDFTASVQGQEFSKPLFVCSSVVASIWATANSPEGSGDSITTSSPFDLIGVVYEYTPLAGENLTVFFSGSAQDWVPGQGTGNIGTWSYDGTGWSWTGLIQQGVLPEFWIHSSTAPAPGSCTNYSFGAAVQGQEFSKTLTVCSSLQAIYLPVVIR